MTVALTRNERRWHWRTWNLLLQIRQATDGEDARQRSGEMTTRGLCIAETSEIRALETREWIQAIDTGELFDDDGNSRHLPVWAVTASGREALKAAEAEGVTVQ
jgi:hypothetical protein